MYYYSTIRAEIKGLGREFERIKPFEGIQGASRIASQLIPYNNGSFDGKWKRDGI